MSSFERVSRLLEELKRKRARKIINEKIEQAELISSQQDPLGPSSAPEFSIAEKVAGNNPIAFAIESTGLVSDEFGEAYARKALDSTGGWIYGIGERMGLVESGTRQAMREAAQASIDKVKRESSATKLVSVGDFSASYLAPAAVGILTPGTAASFGGRIGLGATEGAAYALGEDPESSAIKSAAIGGIVGAGGISAFEGATRLIQRGLAKKAGKLAEPISTMTSEPRSDLPPTLPPQGEKSPVRIDPDTQKQPPVMPSLTKPSVTPLDLSKKKPGLYRADSEGNVWPVKKGFVPVPGEALIRVNRKGKMEFLRGTPLDGTNKVQDKLPISIPQQKEYYYLARSNGEIRDATKSTVPLPGETLVKIKGGKQQFVMGAPMSKKLLESFKILREDADFKDKIKIMVSATEGIDDLSKLAEVPKEVPTQVVVAADGPIMKEAVKADPNRNAVTIEEELEAMDEAVLALHESGAEVPKLQKPVARREPWGKFRDFWLGLKSQLKGQTIDTNITVKSKGSIGRGSEANVVRAMYNIDPTDPLAENAVRTIDFISRGKDYQDAIIGQFTLRARALAEQNFVKINEVAQKTGMTIPQIQDNVRRAYHLRDSSLLVDPSLQEVSNSWSSMIRQMSEELVDSNVLSKAEREAALYRMGSYYHQNYEAWLDPQAWQKANPEGSETYENAIRVVMRSMREAGDLHTADDLRALAAARLKGMVEQGEGIVSFVVAPRATPRVEGEVFLTTIKQLEEGYQKVRKRALEEATAAARKAAKEAGNKDWKKVTVSGIDDESVFLGYVKKMKNRNAADRIMKRWNASISRRPDLQQAFPPSPLQSRDREYLMREAIREEDWPEEIKKWLGYTDDMQSAGLQTVHKVASEIAAIRYDQKVREMGLNSGLFTTQQIGPNTSPITGKASRRGLIEGDKELFTDPITLGLMNAVEESRDQYGLWSKILNSVKLGKVLNRSQILRNAYGAAISTTINMDSISPSSIMMMTKTIESARGAVGVTGKTVLGGDVIGDDVMKLILSNQSSREFMEKIARELSPDGSPEGLVKLTEDLVSRGGLRSQQNQEIIEMLKGMRAKVGKGQATIKDMAYFAGKVYGSPDFLVQAFGFNQRAQKLAWAFGEAEPSERTKDMAAALVLHTYQNYGILPEAVKKMARNVPFGGFWSFRYNMIQNQKNIMMKEIPFYMKQAYQNLGTDNNAAARWAGLGLEKTAGLFVAAGEMMVAAKVVSAAIGWGSEKLNAINETFSYPGSQASPKLVVADNRGKDGSITLVDLGQFDPYDIEDKMAFVVGYPGDITDKLKVAYTEAMNSYFGASLIMKPFMEAYTGHSYSGFTQGYSYVEDPEFPSMLGSGSSVQRNVGKRMYRTWRNIAPSILLEQENRLRAAGILDQQVGSRSYDEAEEAANRNFGIRKERRILPEIFGKTIHREIAPLRGIRKQYEAELKLANGDVQQIAEIRSRHQLDYDKVARKLSWHFSNARDYDILTRDQTWEGAKKGGLSKKMTKKLWDKEIPDFETFLGDAWE